MPLYNGCDNPAEWRTVENTVLTADTTNYVSAPASIRAETPTEQWWCFVARWHWFQDWSAYPIINLWVKVSRVDKPLSLMIATQESLVEHHYPLTGLVANQWQKFVVDLRQPSVEGRVPDLTLLRAVRFDWELQNAGGILNFDQIEFSEIAIPPGKGLLECHAYMDTEEVKATVEVVGIGTFLTPLLLELNPGSYTLRVTYQTQTQERTTTITEGITTREDFTFAAVPPPRPAIPLWVWGLLIGLPAISIVIYAISKKKK